MLVMDADLIEGFIEGHESAKKKARKIEIDLPHRTVHSLRHTNITMQIAAGVPLVTVAGRAGHARTSTTTDIYSHFLKSSDKTVAEKLEQLFE